MVFNKIVNVIVIVLTFVGYLPYIRDILLGKTKPHLFTWFTVSLTAFISYALQVEGGAGIGAWPMFIVACICTIVFVLSITKGTRDIAKIDFLFLILSLSSLYLWLISNKPLASVVLITLSEVMSFLPTIRKAWKDPFSESAILYQVSAFRHFLVIFALEKINLLTALYPIAWSFSNVIITLTLVYRKKSLR